MTENNTQHQKSFSLEEDSDDLSEIVRKYREYVMGKANLAEVLQVVNIVSIKRILKQEKTTQ